MTAEVRSRYGRVAEGFGVRLSRVRRDQWDAATPCSDWDVRTLVSHVIATHRRVASTVSGGEPIEVDSVAELEPQWRAATAEVVASLDDPGRATTQVGGMFGEQSFESLVSRLLCADTLFHTWDLARATGQDEQLDDDAVRQAMVFLEPLDDAIRRPGGFAPKIAPPADADPQTLLLSFGGRVVG